MKIFGKEHLIYMLISTIIGIAAVVLVKLFCKGKKLELAVKIWAYLMFIFWLMNRICVVVRDDDGLKFLPNTYCSVIAIIFYFACRYFKPNAGIFHFVTYAAIFGGLVNYFYPDQIMYYNSIFAPLPFAMLLYHSLMLFLAITLLVTGYVKPSLKKWAWFPLGLCAVMTYGIFLITGLNFYNAIYIKYPLIENTNIYWYHAGIVFLAVHLIFLIIMECVYYKRGEGWFF